ncbi:MAG: hypothetical protein FJ147_24400 [Deltaproteobacteria bacterium]|nr:hypothetical protein [Deltaproteobacteria bacterium]
MRRTTVWRSMMLGLLLSTSPVVWAQSNGNHLAIVVNTANTVEELSMEKLRRIFRGEEAEWDNQAKIEVVTRASGQPEQEAALRNIYGMNQSALNAYFLKAAFARTLKVKPKVLNTALGVRQLVAGVPGAIGIMRASEVDKSVKPLRINGRLPGEAGYELVLQ